MIKSIKRILLSSLSILGIGILIWTVLLLNPSLSYANHTQIDNVTIHHNQQLEEGTDLVIRHALAIIKNADIYDDNLAIHLCLNDDKVYPNLYPFAGATAYAFLNNTVVYASNPNFRENYTEFSWEVNGYESRKYDLTALLAHEFMHNVQYHHDAGYYVKSTLGKLNWKLEGHAEYIAREFKDDNRLREKISIYLTEVEKEHTGIPVIVLDDATIQNLSYFKYALVFQYLREIEQLDFDQICELEVPFDDLYAEMLKWNES